jgi:peroxiredoxin
MISIWLPMIALWGVVFILALLLLGALGNLERLRFQLIQVNARTLARPGREGLELGRRAPAVALLSAGGIEMHLRDLLGQKVVLVFTRNGCPPCHRLLADLNGWKPRGNVQLLVIHNGSPKDVPKWPNLKTTVQIFFQEDFAISDMFQWRLTPIAFVIDEEGVICWKGVVNDKSHVQLALAEAETQRNPSPQKRSAIKEMASR